MRLEVRVKKWDAKSAREYIAIPSDLDHKYSRGVLGVITGSARYPGAAVLTTTAATRTGLGMVRFHSNSGLAHLVLHAAPQVVVQPGPVDAWLIGSGIEGNPYADVTTWLRHRWFVHAKRQTVPTLLDAGGLSLIGKISQPTVITPHAGELASVLQRRGVKVTAEAIEGNPKKWAVEASLTLGTTVLLKGAVTYVADGNSLIELPRATPFLATAGSGDVLAGIIGALIATHHVDILNEPTILAEIAATGAFIHANAAALASAKAPINAPMITEAITPALRTLLK